MFISRKKYEEEIGKAKHETEERIWNIQRMERFEENINRKMSDFERIIYGENVPRIDPVFSCTPSPMEMKPVADAVVNILSSVLKKLIDNKEKFCLTDEDKEVIEAKELLNKMEGAVNE